MNVKVRNFLLKSIPYLLSIAGGLTIFIVSSDEIHNSNLNDLINNISASLLSIPLVFLLYDYSNYLISRRVNKTLADGMMFKINTIMNGMQTLLRNMVHLRKNVSWGEFERMLGARKISLRGVRMTAPQVAIITSYRDQLDDIVYRTVATSTLAHAQIQTLGDIAQELSHMISLHKFSGARAKYEKHIENLMLLMGDWYDSVGAVVADAADAPASVGNNASVG